MTRSGSPDAFPVRGCAFGCCLMGAGVIVLAAVLAKAAGWLDLNVWTALGA